MFYKPNKQKLGINVTQSRDLINTMSPPANLAGSMIVKVRSYIFEQEAGYIPTYAKMTTDLPVTLANVSEQLIPLSKGKLLDSSHTQFENKLYTINLKTARALSIPLHILWDDPITIQVSYNNNSFDIYSEETLDSATQVINLSPGETELRIMTYTASDDKDFSLTMDASNLQTSNVPLDILNITPQIATGQVWVNHVMNEAYSDDYRIEIPTEFIVHEGSALPYCVDDLDDSYGGGCRNIDIRIQRDEEDNIIPITGGETGCYIQYRINKNPETYGFYIAIWYILFGNAFYVEVVQEADPT